MNKVINITTKNVINLKDETSILEASKLMQTLNINHLFITNQKGEHIGLLSSKDILAKLTDALSLDNPNLQKILQTTVSDVMTQNNLIRIEHDKKIQFACTLMLQHNIHSLIVVKNGKDVGLVTSHDCLAYSTGRLKAMEKAKFF